MFVQSRCIISTPCSKRQSYGRRAKILETVPGAIRIVCFYRFFLTFASVCTSKWIFVDGGCYCLIPEFGTRPVDTTNSHIVRNICVNLNLFMDKEIIQFEEQNMINKIFVVLRKSNFCVSILYLSVLFLLFYIIFFYFKCYFGRYRYTT